MVLNKKVRFEFLYNKVVTIFNFFCIAPLSLSNDLSQLKYNGVKITMFTILLTSAVSFEIYDILIHVMGIGRIGPPIPANFSDFEESPTQGNFFQNVNNVRYSYLSVHIVAVTVNILINQPRRLTRFYCYCRCLDLFLPIYVQLWKLAVFIGSVGLFSIVECWLFTQFRYPGGMPDGSYVRARIHLAITLYVCMTCVASEVLFYITVLVNHFYYQCILQDLQKGRRHYSGYNRKHNINPKREFICQKPHEIIQLRDLFGTASDMRECINLTFTVQFLFSSTRAFVDSTAAIFMAIQHVTRKHKNPGENETFLYAWCVTLLIKIIIMTTLANYSKQDIENIAIEIHRRFNRTIDLTTKFELLAFSQEIMHRKGPFTALNLFEINHGLIASIIGTISTYLIILLQFRQ